MVARSRPWRRLQRNRTAVSVVVLLVLVAVSLRGWLVARSKTGQPFQFDSAGPYRVKRVVDGDTLLLVDGTRVRLIGVNTPETKHPSKPVSPLGVEAAAFTKKHVEGRDVTLQFDRERRDKYHRVLAYVYRDDWFLNEELIRAGFSKAETRFPYSSRMKKRFKEAEAEAREHRRGLWAE